MENINMIFNAVVVIALMFFFLSAKESKDYIKLTCFTLIMFYFEYIIITGSN